MIYKTLIVDDEPRILQGIKKVLHEQYHNTMDIRCAESGKDALSLIRLDPIDLLITDIRMPGMSGLELLTTLRNEQHFFTALLLTGHAEFKYAKSAIQLNVLNYLLKPIGKQQLISEVDHAIQSIEEHKLVRKGTHLVEQHPSLFHEYFEEVENPVIQQVLMYMHQHFDSPLTLELVANQVHLHRSYLSSLFKDVMGVTFSEYLNTIRIERAKCLLRETQLRVYEVAISVGYANSKYFVTVFKSLVGVTPNKYRTE